MWDRKEKKEQKVEERALFSYASKNKSKKINDLTARILFTLAVLVVIRIASNIPIPGLDSEVFDKWFSEKFSSSGGFFNVMTGGSFANMSILALNITPVITSSIIVQFASMLIRPLEKLMRDEDGQKMMAQITRYLAMIIAFVESGLFALSFYQNGYFTDNDGLAALSMIFIITAGSAVTLWFADLISEYGVGNGVTVILVADILMSVPSDIILLWQRFVAIYPRIPMKFLSVLLVAFIVCLIIAYVVIMQECEHRFPVQGSYGTSSIMHMHDEKKKQNYIPMKLNAAGVMPVIFAQAVLQLPTWLASLGFNVQKGFFNFLALSFEQKNWFNLYYPEYSFGMLVFLVIIVLFSYFYANISFSPEEIADHLRETGTTIPGIRPGIETAKYLRKSARAMNFLGACALSIIALIPIFITAYYRIELSLGGTSLIIIVGGITEVVQQIRAEKYKQRLID